MASSQTPSETFSVTPEPTPPRSPSPAPRPAGAPPPSSTGRGIHDTAYAARRRALMQLINNVRSAGASLDVDLPRIAVIGNQSAGKSSLVEAISEIKVPRSEGTCTRCPFEIRLQNADVEWTCQVRLRVEDRDDANGIREFDFGPAIHDRDDVELALRRAQTAVLNFPDVPLEEFTDIHVAALGSARWYRRSQRNFTRDVVCVDIKGRDVTDLAFVDLPGIIHVGDAREVRLVTDLINEYIEGNCLILLVLPMHDDIETQSACTLARNADPFGERTIGVVTKPDTISDGRTNWMEIICGNLEKNRLRHGYYVTKQPGSNNSQGISFSAAREGEERYFREEDPWASASEPLKGRLGTKKLTSALSILLSSFIDNKLDGLSESASRQHTAVSNMLAELPNEPSVDPIRDTIELVVRFSAEIKAHMYASPEHLALFQACRFCFDSFADGMRDSLPVFVAEEARPAKEVEAGLFDVDEEMFGEPASHGKQKAGMAEKKGKRGVKKAKTSTKVRSEVAAVDDHAAIYLREVRQVIKDSTGHEFPFSVPFSAKLALISRPQPKWRCLAHNLFADVKPEVMGTVEIAIENHFRQFAHGRLDNRVRDIVNELVDDIGGACIDFLDAILALEDLPQTRNLDFFFAERERKLAEFKRERSRSRSGEPPLNREYYLSQAIDNLASAGINTSRMDLDKLLPRDPWEEELVVAAETSAYHQVAYKRLIDFIPAAINHQFLRALGDRVQGAVLRQLEIDNKEACRAYLAEDPAIVRERDGLRAKLSRLEEARVAFRDFGVMQDSRGPGSI